ncbi:MAG: hypothetical protein AAF704_05270 [Cyanobacteria bacterium P01_D01_bin.123]
MKNLKTQIVPLRNFLRHHRWTLGAIAAFWGTYFVALFTRAVVMKTDGLYAGHVNIWSDWSLHIGMVSIFAYKAPSDWFAYHPIYAGGQFTYGFLTNLISGLLVRGGLSLIWALILPSLAYIGLLLLGSYLFFVLVLKSRKQAVAAISIFFLSAGLGGIGYIRDAIAQPTLSTLLYPALEYSRMERYSWGTGNVIVGMILPQRAFLLGMTLALWGLVGLLFVVQRSSSRTGTAGDRWILVASSCAVGILPITHAHSFIVMLILSAAVVAVNLKRWRMLAFYAVPGSILAISLYLTFIWGGIDSDRFARWMFGWTADNGLGGWILMWWQLWGVMLPTAIVGWFLLWRRPWLVKALFLGFFAIFALGNSILIQPIAWDNSKLFAWAYFGFAGLAAVAIAHCWHYRVRWLGRSVAVALAIALTLTGSIELLRLQRVDRHQYRMTSADEIQLGELIRQRTDPLAVFLTAPEHNHWVMMWGARPVLMGYPAWVLNFGFVYQQRERDLSTMYEGGVQAAHLLEQYAVSYVAVGPNERNRFDINETYFQRNFPIVFQTERHQIYDVRSLWCPTRSASVFTQTVTCTPRWPDPS